MSDWVKSYLHAMRNLSGFVDQVLVSGGNFLTLAICAHTLSLSEQGKFNYVFASYMALLMLNIGGIFQGAAVRAPGQDSVSYKISLARLQLLLAVILSLLVSTAWMGAGSVLGWQITTAEASLMCAFLSIQQLADFDRRSAYIFSGTKRAIYSSAVTYPLRVISLLIIRPDSVSKVLLVLAVSAFIPAAITIFTACKFNFVNIRSSLTAIVKHLEYSLLFIAGAPIAWLWSYIPIFMLGIFYGKEQVALLSSIRGLCGIANVMIEQIEIKIVAGWSRVNHGEGPFAMGVAVSRLFKIIMVCWLLVMLVIIFFGREIVDLVLGKLYEPHWHLFEIAWVGYGVYLIARLLGIKHRVLGARHLEFIGNSFGALAALVAGFIMIPTLQVTGAAWVYVAIPTAILIGQMFVLENGDRAAKRSVKDIISGPNEGL